jgi:hypothetical protein
MSVMNAMLPSRQTIALWVRRSTSTRATSASGATGAQKTMPECMTSRTTWALSGPMLMAGRAGAGRTIRATRGS